MGLFSHIFLHIFLIFLHFFDDFTNIFVEFTDFFVEFTHFFVATDVYALPLIFFKSLPTDLFPHLVQPAR